jgi:hypothetical protein
MSGKLINFDLGSGMCDAYVEGMYGGSSTCAGAASVSVKTILFKRNFLCHFRRLCEMRGLAKWETRYMCVGLEVNALNEVYR